MSISEGSLPWLEKVKSAEKTCIIQDGKRKVHYKFNDNEEMAEEYNMQTDVLVRRAWRRRGALKKDGDWEVEMGDPEPMAVQNLGSGIGLMEANNMPYVVKRITKGNIEWRIRNLHFPLETYSVSANPTENCITVRTTNKKYFKNLPVPELERVGLVPKQENISFAHNLNVLIIMYKKPPEVLQAEQAVLALIKSVKTIKDPGELPCNPS
ncbi:hypothetical protein GE061_006959 [Apolygus lucorum]|uniref:Protein DPCD n=1 Tax=Apolygus lucorum TaxID=248454 RepID=A0A6A4II28_APOLU|nr:hypothetical protein GE061_006959 [Apolygus lucorum]